MLLESPPMPYSNPPQPALRSLGGLAVTVAVHAILLLAWQTARRATAPEAPSDNAAMFVVPAPVYILPRPLKPVKPVKPLKPRLPPAPLARPAGAVARSGPAPA
ncbi:hypothetical protein C7C56_023950, partial [Massilia glaciei]